MTTTAFTLFPALPFELRHQIWRNALPEHRRPTLYLYRGKGCWVPRPLVEGDPGYIAGRVMDQLGFDFLTDRFGHDNQFDLPLYFANREARKVALAWLKQQGIKMRLAPGQRIRFIRLFNPELDALYIPRDRWEAFYNEPIDRMLEPDLHGQSVDLHSELLKIAVSDALFFESPAISWIPEMEMWYEGLGVLLVVIGPQPDFGSIPGQWRWELEGTEGPSFFWNKDNEAFDFHGGNEDVSDKALYEKIGETAKSRLREPLIQRRLDHFQIQPVFAGRRAV